MFGWDLVVGGFFWFVVLVCGLFVWVFFCVYAWFLFLSNTQGTWNVLHVVPRELCVWTRVSWECVCVCVQSAFVFRGPGMMSVKASKQSLYIEQGAQQRLLGEKPVRDAGKLQSSPQSSVPCAPEHLSIDHYWHLQGDGSHSSPGFSGVQKRKTLQLMWRDSICVLPAAWDSVIPGMSGEDRAVIQSKMDHLLLHISVQ